ncbi:DUF6082 family protein [Streptomyces sp. CdTB01]|uniref:DUF6082 family protein n=1 Tax=Streptomyces sp. CdTB01 TaxID=1725411 RepID=UPI001EF015E6|nr:DUF6082 family protein [Streptomyces sp. CdTB01]
MADELAHANAELRKANEIELHRLFMEQLDRAIDDPALADALSTLEGVSKDRRRQMLFANRQYGLNLLAYRLGTTSRAELLGSLRILSRNRVFAECWERTASHRRELPTDSLEARTGKAVDVIMDERWDELDEWWVVGSADADADADAESQKDS